jgi:hypothetical protein
MGYVRDRAGRTHVIHLRDQGLWYLTRRHGAAPGPSGWTRRMVPDSGRLGLVHHDLVGLVLSLSGDRLYLVVQTHHRLYVVSKRPDAPNFPAITASDVTVSSGFGRAVPQLQVAALPRHQLAILTTVPTPNGHKPLSVYVVTPGQVLSKTTLVGSGHDNHNARLSYDPDSGWLIAGANEGATVFVWQRSPGGESWTGAQQAEGGDLDSLTAMHGRAYMGLQRVDHNQPFRPLIAVTRLGTTTWSARHHLPHSSAGNGDLLLKADPEHHRLQAIYIASDRPGAPGADPNLNNHIDHQVRDRSGRWSDPTRISPRGGETFPRFLVLTNRGGYRFAYVSDRSCT